MSEQRVGKERVGWMYCYYRQRDENDDEDKNDCCWLRPLAVTTVLGCEKGFSPASLVALEEEDSGIDPLRLRANLRATFAIGGKACTAGEG